MKTVVSKILALCRIFFFATALAAQGTTYYFTNNVGVWENEFNWSPNGSPGPGDTAVITTLCEDGPVPGFSGTPMYVYLETNETVANVIIGGTNDGGCGGGEGGGWLVTGVNQNVLTVTNVTQLGLGGILEITGGGLRTHDFFGTNYDQLSLDESTLSFDGQMILDVVGEDSLLVTNGVIDCSAGATMDGNIGVFGNGLSFGGIVTLGTNGSLTLGGFGGYTEMTNLVLINYGTITWLGGIITLAGASAATNASVIYNYGLWKVECDEQMGAGCGTNQSGGFYNFGTFEKSGTSGVTSIVFDVCGNGVAFYSSGEVNIETGTLDLASALGGAFTGGAVTGAVDFSTGSFTVDNTLMTTNVILDGANFVGQNVFYGGVTWYNGSFLGGSSATVASNCAMNIVSDNYHGIGNAVFTNLGVLNWLGGQFGPGALGGAIYNYGLFQIQCDEVMNGGPFINGGVVSKTGTSGLTEIGTSLTNSGTIDIETGTLQVDEGGAFTGGTVTNSGTVLLEGQTFSLVNTLTTTNVQLDGVDLVGNASIIGGLTWQEGAWGYGDEGAVTLTSNSVLNIVYGGSHDLFSSFSNYGQVNWTAGTVGSGGGTIYNNGLWLDQCDSSIESAFNNAGTFSKTVTSGITTCAGSMNNTGVFDVETGSVYVENGGLLTGGTITNVGTVYLDQGYFTLDGVLTSTNVQLTAACNLAGDNVIMGGLTWAGGTWGYGVPGTVTLTSNSLLNIVSDNTHTLYGSTFINNGLVEWYGGGIGQNGTVIENSNLWIIQCDQSTGGGNASFDNYGVLRKLASTNSTSFGNLNNYGLLDVEQGSVVIGGVSLGGGAFSAAVDSSIVFDNNYYFSAGATFPGAGTIVLAGGAMTAAAPMVLTNVLQVGGDLAADLTVNGLFVWSNGNWNGSGWVAIASHATFDISGPGQTLSLPNGVLTNAGTVVWTGGDISGGGLFLVNNGLWMTECDQQVVNGGLSNAGAFTKTVTTGATVFNEGLANTGIFQIQTGSVLVENGGLFLGGAITNSGSVLLQSGNFTIDNCLTSTNVQLDGGSLAGVNVIQGGLTWAGGNWANGSTVTLAPNSLMNITSSADHGLPNSIFTNLGDVEWLGGRIRGGGNSSSLVYNEGIWDVLCDQPFNSDFGGLGYVGFYDTGLFRKLAGANTTSFLPTGSGVYFTDAGGEVDVERGTLSLPSGSTLPGLLNLAVGGSGPGQWGEVIFAGAGAFHGVLNVVLTNGYQPSATSVFPLVAAGPLAGGYTVKSLPPAAVLVPTNNAGANMLDLLITAGSVTVSAQLADGSLDLQFPTWSNETYTIQQSTNLLDWSLYQHVTGNGQPFMAAIALSSNPPVQFFRVLEP